VIGIIILVVVLTSGGGGAKVVRNPTASKRLEAVGCIARS
jgi:hypothetical protein